MAQETQQQKDNRVARFITLIVAIGPMQLQFGDQITIQLVFYLVIGTFAGAACRFGSAAPLSQSG